MVNLSCAVRVYLHIAAVDMRKSFNGLFAIARHQMNKNPMDGSLFVFCNRNRTMVKILLFDGTGLWVMAKRLEQGTFWWPTASDEGAVDMDLKHESLAMLLGGVDLKKGSLRPWFCR